MSGPQEMAALLIGQIALQLITLLIKPFLLRFIRNLQHDQGLDGSLLDVAMDAYPQNYTSHNVPLVVLSGLGTTKSDGAEARYPLFQEKGIRISSESPNVSGPEVKELSECFRDFDARDAAWNHRPSKGKMGSMSFTYRHVGRVGQNVSCVSSHSKLSTTSSLLTHICAESLRGIFSTECPELSES